MRNLLRDEMKKVLGGVNPVPGCNAQQCSYLSNGELISSFCMTLPSPGTGGTCQCEGSGGLLCYTGA